MMNAQILIVSLAAFLVVWLYQDYKLQKNGKQTVTQVTIAASAKYPLIPWGIGFFMGLLTGHLYG